VRRGSPPKRASSGKTNGRHRLNRGGDRAANSALYIVTIVRLRHHEATREYVKRRTAEGLSKREIIRCLKRYIAREVFAALLRVRRCHGDRSGRLANIGASKVMSAGARSPTRKLGCGSRELHEERFVEQTATGIGSSRLIQLTSSSRSADIHRSGRTKAWFGGGNDLGCDLSVGNFVALTSDGKSRVWLGGRNSNARY
jgi:hypothetical protein